MKRLAAFLLGVLLAAAVRRLLREPEYPAAWREPEDGVMPEDPYPAGLMYYHHLSDGRTQPVVQPWPRKR